VRVVALATLLCLAVAPLSAAHAETMTVLGRACVPNAFAPALPCTLRLDAPGDRLLGRGLRMFAEPEVRPDPRGEFGYLPFGVDDYSFDQVNVFWHAQNFLDRLERYGLDREAFPIYVHVTPGAGSFTHFTEPVSTIGTGANGTDRGAKDSDIIVHEITHAVFNPRMPLGIYPLDKGESIPILEGIADYFAAAVNGDTHIGEFAKPPLGYHDIASDPRVYHYDRWNLLPGDPYSLGMVFNGALLEIRDALGETADELVFRALDHGPLRCFTCFADAVRWADDEHFAGAHLAVIDAAFARRGIPSGPPTGLSIDVPSWAWLQEDITVRLLHKCGAGPFEVTWRVSDAQGNEEVLPSGAEQVVYRPSQPVTFKATLKDRNGVTFEASPRLVTTYDRNDPAVHVGTVSIVGPRDIPLGFRARYTYALTGGAGVPPTIAQWQAENAQLFVMEPTGAAIDVVPFATPVRLWLTYRDATGQIARDSLVVNVQQPLFIGTVTGPAVLQQGATGVYSVRPTGGLRPYRYAWTQQVPSQTVSLPESSTVTSLPATVDFTLRATVTDAAGRSASALLNVRTIGALVVSPIEGPADLVAGRTAMFSVSTGGGLAPFHYQWSQVNATTTRWLADASRVTSLPESGDFTLQVLTTDAGGTSVSRTHLVRVLQALRVGSIEGPSSLFEGEVARFSARPQGGRLPYRYRWYQGGDGGFRELGDSISVASLPASHDFTIVATVRDSTDVVAQTSRLVTVQPGPPPPPPPPVSRTFRVLGNVLRRGGNLVIELPTPDAEGEVEVLDATGRLRASGRIPVGSAPQLSLSLPRDLDSGIYFVRLRRSDHTWSARIVVIAG